MLSIPGRIPVNIHPLFWVLAAFIGYINSFNFVYTILWIVIIFISVLIHEFGHAITALIFGKKPRIDLIALGGVTTYETGKLSYFKQFLIVLFGPVFGFILFLLATLILYVGIFTQPKMLYFFKVLQIVNLFWTIVNLIPVIPLDGGQLLRILMEGIFGTKGLKISFFIGMVVSALIACVFFVMQMFLLGALFFLFAFQSFDVWRKSKHISDPDRDDDNKRLLMNGEAALQEGRKIDAKVIFEQIREKAKKGILFVTASQYLAYIYKDEGKAKEAYEMLLPIKDKLTEESSALLHELAFDQQDYDLVAELSSVSYQIKPTKDTALRNARAFAFLKKPAPAGGWLQTASNFGDLNLEQVLSESIFENIKNDPIFREFISKIR